MRWNYIKDCHLIDSICCYCNDERITSTNIGYTFKLYDEEYHRYFTLDLNNHIQPLGFRLAGTMYEFIERVPEAPWVHKETW